jgi:hypothetical protein
MLTGDVAGAVLSLVALERTVDQTMLSKNALLHLM